MSKVKQHNPYSGISVPSYTPTGPAPVKPVEPDIWAEDDTGRSFDEQMAGYRSQMDQYNQQYTEWLDKSVAGGFGPDGKPLAPEFVSMIDPETGRLKDAYQLDPGLIDPTQVAGYDQFSDLATGTGLTQQGQAAQEQLDLKTKFLRDQATADAGGARADAMSNLAMRGGMTGGARERMMSGFSPMAGRQKARQAQIMGTSDIGIASAQSRESALKDFVGMGADVEQFNVNAGNQAQEFNIGQALNEMGRERDFGMDRYKEQGAQWAADKKAAAQRASSGGGGGGCCFIFLEARYGDGTMDKVVRKFRDEKMTPRNQRGYYKLSEVLVPLMRKSKFVKFLVRTTMTDPLVSYGKYHYGEGKVGRVFAPVKRFWLKMFDYLGQDHTFVRENGETV